MKTVVCIGDSITKGHISVNYVDLLQQQFGKDFCFINKGIDGDLAYNVLNRLDDIIAIQPDYITILIGTNDVLATYSDETCNYYRLSKALPVCPSRDWFIENLEEIIKQLQLQTSAKIALVSLPLITEEKECTMYQGSIEYSGIMEEMAAKYGTAYLRLNEAQQEFYKIHESQPTAKYMQQWKFSVRVAFKHFILRKSLDDISKEYGFLLTVDHVHQNSIGANQIKDIIIGYLLENKTE